MFKLRVISLLVALALVACMILTACGSGSQWEGQYSSCGNTSCATFTLTGDGNQCPDTDTENIGTAPLQTTTVIYLIPGTCKITLA